MTAEKVLLWRHGRTTHNHSRTWQGQLDTQLDDVGRAQAQAGAAALAPVLGRWRDAGRLVRMVVSDLSRCRDTATPLEELAGLTAEVDPRLREISAGAWEGLTREEIARTEMVGDLDAWRRGDDVRLGGNGETRSEAALRAAAALVEHAGAMDGGLLVAVTHGGVSRGATLSLLGLPPGEWDRLASIRNCHWVDLQPGDPRWTLNAFNVGADPEPIWSPTPTTG